MKQFITVLSALLVSLGVCAQSGAEVLRAMGERVASMGSYRIDFSLEMAGAENPSRGYCKVDGEKYVIGIDDIMQGCDGETLWVVSGVNREITLDSPSPQSRSLFDNPTRAFDFEDGLFEVTHFDAESADVWNITLRPAEGVLEGIESVVLEVSRKTGLPTLLGYDMGGVSLFVRIEKFAPTKPEDGDFVRPEIEGYEVIDFR